MFTLETKNNGIVIGVAYVTKEKHLSKEEFFYKVRYEKKSNHNKIDKEPSSLKFKVAHKPKDGPEKLASIVFEGIFNHLREYKNNLPKK